MTNKTFGYHLPDDVARLNESRSTPWSRLGLPLLYPQAGVR